MSVVIKHSKTANFLDWTQADVDKQIALGNLPAGTTPADMVLKTDWNDDHSIISSGGDGIVFIENGEINSTSNATLDSAGNETLAGLLTSTYIAADGGRLTNLVLGQFINMPWGGVVRVNGSNGTQVTYPAVANTDSERGSAFLTALGDTSAGDSIYLTPTTFNVGGTGFSNNGANVYGMGADFTKIICTADGDGFVVDSNTVVANLTFDFQTMDYVHGMTGDGADNVYIVNCKIYGGTDTTWFNNCTNFYIINCQFYGGIADLQFFGTSTAFVYDTYCRSDDTRFDDGVTQKQALLFAGDYPPDDAGHSIIKCWNSIFSVQDNGNPSTTCIAGSGYGDGGSQIYLYDGCQVIVDGSDGTYIGMADGFSEAFVSPSTVYDPARSGGTITEVPELDGTAPAMPIEVYPKPKLISIFADYTENNTLDDGSGNMSIIGNFAAAGGVTANSIASTTTVSGTQGTFSSTVSGSRGIFGGHDQGYAGNFSGTGFITASLAGLSGGDNRAALLFMGSFGHANSPTALFEFGTDANANGGADFYVYSSASGFFVMKLSPSAGTFQFGKIGTADILFNSGSGTCVITANTSTSLTGQFKPRTGAAGAGSAPIKLTSGTNNTTAETGAVEYNGTNLFFTRTGTTRENILVAVDNAAAPSTNLTPTFTSYYGGNTKALGDPNRWISVNILGTVYKIPMYT